MSNKDDILYLLSMTFHGSDGQNEIWLDDDDSALAPTSSMGSARTFPTENDAREFRNAQHMNETWQITPISGKRYFKARLQGRT